MQTGRAVQLAAKHAERSDGAHAVSGFHLPLGCAAPHPRAPPPQGSFHNSCPFCLQGDGVATTAGCVKERRGKTCGEERSTGECEQRNGCDAKPCTGGAAQWC